MTKKSSIPIITLDGPGGAGKGTVAAMVAKELGFHLLDSGALYRLVAIDAENKGISFENEAKLAEIAKNMDMHFLLSADKISDDKNGEGEESDVLMRVYLGDEDVSQKLRLENTGYNASLVAAKPLVRKALLVRQKAQLKEPGLVADGRDMGTVVFPDAAVKIFLTASAEERAQRRYKQLIDKGENVNLRALLAEIQARDERDINRPVAPLKPADDALFLDSTLLSIMEVKKVVLDYIDLKTVDLKTIDSKNM